ncbi:MAG: hypothetical protein HDT09_02025 [Bacteroidales bacterium]|nr:hypothetical protein [Bacteroidales bacterium]
MNLPALRSEDISLILNQAPESYSINQLSSSRCCDFGQQLLNRIQAEGMSDELDAECASYIEKSRRTMTTMNNRRSPVTKLFDMIRSGYTSMENSVDPNKNGSIPNKIQQARNSYATQKHRQAELERQQEQQRQLRQQAKARYKADLEYDLNRQLSELITEQVGRLQKASAALTLENFDVLGEQIRRFPIDLDGKWLTDYRPQIPLPPELATGEALLLQGEVIRGKGTELAEHYRQSVGEYRDTLVDNLAAKRKELEAMALADEQEKQRRAAALVDAERAELLRLESERHQKEAQAAAVDASRRQAAQMDGLFSQASVASATYVPKTTVKYKVQATSPDGIYEMIAMWWAREGKGLSVEELSKIFKRQITFCEKLANSKDAPEFIRSENLVYEEEVKAK